MEESAEFPRVTVPPTQVAALLDALDHLSAVTSGADRPEYERMTALLRASGGRPVQLTAGPFLLREALVVAIDEAGERVSELATEVLRGSDREDAAGGRSQTGALRARVAVLSALLDLLETLESRG